MHGTSASAPSVDAARRHAESVVKRSGTSFYWAMRRLPDDKRHALYAIYAFCREVDDIADDPGRPPDKRARLDSWRAEIDALYAGRPGRPVAIALAGPVARFGLDRNDFMAVIAGMEMDAGDSLRISNVDELFLYCDRVASAVGRLCNRVFGIDSVVGDRVARALGQALQITNILRDIHEDAGRDRLYLPADRLAAHGIAATDSARVLTHPALPVACAELAALARERFAQAAAALAACDRRQVRPAIMMMDVYRRLLLRLEARGWTDLERRVRLTMAEKLWVLLRHGFV